MSRADWSFLERLLEEGQEHSTGIGRVWLTVLFLFRILVLAAAAESAWDDEQSDFVCNTKQPGCDAVCYDKAFPVSHFRYFVLQIIFVSTPTIFYFGFVAVRAGRREAQGQEEEQEERRRQERRGHGGGSGRPILTLEVRHSCTGNVIQEKEEVGEEEGGGAGGRRRVPEAPKLKGRLLGAYAVSIVLKLALEVAFIVGLWYLYGFVIPARYECRREPCPHTVDCFVSRPTEKTIFTIYIQAIAAISVLLNVLELFSLLQHAITHHLEKRYLRHSQPIRARHITRAPSRMETSHGGTPAPAYEERGLHYLPVAEGGYPAAEGGDWAVGPGGGPGEGGVQESAGDLLPSYLNCISSMRPLGGGGHHGNKQHQHQQLHRQSKRSKQSGHKGGAPKRKHYV
ncbi:hypothetical protein ACEWY4_023626 [Coilia grayii]|uniref:Gap junction protein n=1 Tax=Coilia grayii TaxID=363190 RepID=A0ABD1J1Q6_9TELE